MEDYGVQRGSTESAEQPLHADGELPHTVVAAGGCQRTPAVGGAQVKDNPCSQHRMDHTLDAARRKARERRLRRGTKRDTHIDRRLMRSACGDKVSLPSATAWAGGAGDAQRRSGSRSRWRWTARTGRRRTPNLANTSASHVFPGDPHARETHAPSRKTALNTAEFFSRRSGNTGELYQLPSQTKRGGPGRTGLHCFGDHESEDGCCEVRRESSHGACPALGLTRLEDREQHPAHKHDRAARGYVAA